MKKDKPEKSNLNKNENGGDMSKSNNQETNENADLEVDQFISLLRDLPNGIVLIRDNDIFFNVVVEKIIGYKNDEIKDLEEWFQLLHRDNADIVKSFYTDYRKKDFESEIILDLFTKSGEIRKVAFKDKVSFIGEMWGLEDKTELIEVKTEKMKKDETLDYLLQFVDVGFWELNLETNNLIWNDNMYSIYGISKDKTVNSYEDYRNSVHPDDIEQAEHNLALAIDGSVDEFNNNFRIIQPDGTIKHIRATAKIRRDNDGKAKDLVGLNWDITEEVEQERANKKLKEQYLLAIDSLEVGVWDWTLADDGLEWNKAIYKQFGVPESSKGLLDIWQSRIHPDDLERVSNNLEHVINTPGEEYNIQYRIVVPDGTIKHIKVYSKAYRNEDGVCYRMIGLSWDVTKEVEQERAEKKLKEHFSLVIDSLEMGVWDWTLEGDDPEWNDAMYKLFELPESSKGLIDIWRTRLHPEDLERVSNNLEHVINTPGEEFNTQFRMVMPDGNIKYIKTHSKAYRNEDGICYRLIGLNWDITKEVYSKEEGNRLSRKYELILNNIQIGVWSYDIKSDKVIRSKTIFELFETEEDTDDSFEATFERLSKKAHPEDIEKLNRDMAIIMSGELDNLESEIRIITPSGSIKYLKSIVNNEKDNNGNLVRVYGIFIDNTNIKKYEKELVKSKEKAEAANEAKSEFLANMSHEIRTPMNAIMGLTYLIQKTELHNSQRDYLDKIQTASASLLGILNDILDFSKIEAGKIELENIEFEIDDILESVSDIITDKAHEKGLEVIFSISQDVPRSIISDPLRVKQIILNLCSNSLKFTESGEILIEIEKVNTKSEQLELKVSITDTGIGMKEEQIKNLFKSFTQADSSTTRNYGGSGLGLVISKDLVELLGGEIGVESEYGKGSKFFFTFKYTASSNENNSRVPDTDLQGVKVLVCEDNKSLIKYLQRSLSSLYLEVTVVSNGDDAIKKLKTSKSDPYDILLVDWEIKCIETIKEINKLDLTRRPKIIAMSTDSSEEDLQKVDKIKIDAFLSKPILPSVLFDSIASILESRLSTETSNISNPVDNFPEQNKLSGKKVLLAEDNEINQLVASELLTVKGMLVDIANNGNEAVQMVQLKSYDFVLMDLHMPIIDGYEAAKKIRKHYSSKELPIIAMTADAMEGVKEKCYEAGMNDYLAKPIKVNKLYRCLLKWLSPSLTNQINADDKSDLKNKIDGIDLEFGLSVVGGNEKLYVKLLGKFDKGYQNFFEEFLSNSDKDREQTIREIHNLKGVAGNIGAKELYNLANKYNRLLEGDFLPNKDNMNDLKLELDKVLKSTSEYIKSVNEGSL